MRKDATHTSSKTEAMLTESEIRFILRAADDIIACGGRTMLGKILKGSRDKKVLELEFDKNPAYGCFNLLKMEEIIEKIDWMIQHDFLEIQYNGKLPMVIFSQRGWTIQRDQYANEMLRQWEDWLAGNITPVSMEYLKDRNRGLILLFLEKIRKTGDTRYIPFLRRWEKIDYKKVVLAIRRVVDCLESGHIEEDIRK